MNGKLKLKLNRNFIKKNKYQVLIDDVLIGELDYKNLKLDLKSLKILLMEFIHFSYKFKLTSMALPLIPGVILAIPTKKPFIKFFIFC